MKIKSLNMKVPKTLSAGRGRTPRVAVARSVGREAPQRVWSLLLPPTFPIERER